MDWQDGTYYCFQLDHDDSVGWYKKQCLGYVEIKENRVIAVQGEFLREVPLGPINDMDWIVRLRLGHYSYFVLEFQSDRNPIAEASDESSGTHTGIPRLH